MVLKEWSMTFMVDDNHNFRTSDTSLAAYLRSEGYTLRDIDYSNEKRAVLVFALETPETLKEIDEKCRNFYSAKAMGNIAMYHDAYRKLARMIRNKIPV